MEQSKKNRKTSLVAKGGALSLLVVLGLLVYCNTLSVPFIFDDDVHITENRVIRLVHLNLKEIYKAGFQSRASNRPVANISFALNYYLSQYNVKGYHIVNITIHIINGILVYFFALLTLRLASRDTLHQNLKTPLPFSLQAFLVSLLWLVHPIQIQSVTYIVQRVNSMAVMFYMLSLLLYICGRLTQVNLSKGFQQSEETPFLNWKALALFSGSLVSWILALGSKEIAATLPLIVLLYEWCFFQNTDLFWLKKNLKYLFGFLIILSVCIFLYLGKNPFDRILAGYSLRDFTPMERLLTQFRVIVLYISLLLFPHPSRLNLDHHITTSQTLFDPISTFFSLMVILCLIGLSLSIIRKERLLSFCLLWFCINLVIESSIIGLEMVFEHRLYLPSVGYFFIIVSLVFRGRSYIFKGGKSTEREPFAVNWVPLIFLAPIVMLLMTATYQRNKVWKDDLTLWSDAVKKSPHKARPHNNLGLALTKQGKINEAVFQYSEALRIQPKYIEAHNNIGVALVMQGKISEALYHFSETLRLSPGDMVAHNHLAVLLSRQGKITEAINHFYEALKRNPKNPLIHYNLANTLSKQDRVVESIEHYYKAIEIDPGFPESHNNLGLVLLRSGRSKEAIFHFREALRLRPGYIAALNNLNRALAFKENEPAKNKN